ncbi:TPA: hypothetical protein KDY89_004515 [Vibrio parahaemolyticus]|nr:hypothetical protein [Vibrio parahaemolyticus]
MKPHDEGLYCPDTLNCRWESHGPIGRKNPRISIETLEACLYQAISARQSLKTQRIKALLAR